MVVEGNLSGTINVVDPDGDDVIIECQTAYLFTDTQDVTTEYGVSFLV